MIKYTDKSINYTLNVALMLKTTTTKTSFFDWKLIRERNMKLSTKSQFYPICIYKAH